MSYPAALPSLLLLLTFAAGMTPLAALAQTGHDAADTGQWIQLFNGCDLSGWTPKITGYEVGENYADTFRVEDGVLCVGYDKYDGSFSDRFGHLFYNRPFSSYVLRVEYRFVGEQYAGGPEWGRLNSGVMIHGQAPESMARDQFFPVSIEVQLLGAQEGEERSTANVCTPGTIVDLDGRPQEGHCTNSSSGTFAGNQWVTVEIEVHGDRLVRHQVNGQKVLEYTDLRLADEGPDTRRLLDAGAAKKLSSGTISLQAESHPIEFRKVELRELDK